MVGQVNDNLGNYNLHEENTGGLGYTGFRASLAANAANFVQIKKYDP